MKTLLLLSAVLALTGAPSLAADLPAKAPVAPTAVTPWSGIYFGVLGTGAKSENEAHSLINIPGSGSLKPSGMMAGGLVGFGGFYGNVLIAVEIDGSYDFSKADTTCITADGKDPVITSCSLKSGWFLTQRLVLGAPIGSITGAAQRVGRTAPTQYPTNVNVPNTFAAANIVPYVTAGIAERRIKACFAEICGHEWMAGSTLGGGIKIPVSSGMSFDVSYLYTSWRKNFISNDAPESLFPAQFRSSSEQMLRMGLYGHF
jgi:opacity protein-like surface antigen